MIEWLLRHPVAIVVIVMIVSALFRQKKAANTKASTVTPPRAGGTGAAARSARDGQPEPAPGFDDSDDDFGVGSAASAEAERTRRIQEEIRRKIAARLGQPVTPPPVWRINDEFVATTSPTGPMTVLPVPVMSPQAMAAQAKREEIASPLQRREAPAFTSANVRPSAPAAVVAQASAVDGVLEQQRQLAEKLDALNAAQRAAAKASTLPVTSSAATDAGGAGWLRELRGARSLRKAIILREVVGPPVALR